MAARKAVAPSSSPVYIYVGPEVGERDAAVELVAAAMKKQYGSVETQIYYATETSVGDALTMAQGVSLFDNAVCVVLRSAEVIKKKEDVAMIAAFANEKASNSALILVSDETSIDAKLEKAVPSSQKKIFWEMYDNKKLPYLIGLFRSSGYSVDSDAAQDILDMTENNTTAFKIQVQRFCTLFPKGHCVTADDVSSVLSHDKEESAFSLFDAMIAGGLEQSLEILAKIRLTRDNSSVMLIAGLTSCFRRLIAYHALQAAGADEFKMKTAGFAARKAREQYGRAAKKWTRGEAMAILAEAAQTDADIRSGGAGVEDTLLITLLYKIIVKKGAPMEKYCALLDGER